MKLKDVFCLSLYSYGQNEEFWSYLLSSSELLELELDFLLLLRFDELWLDFFLSSCFEVPLLGSSPKVEMNWILPALTGIGLAERLLLPLK